MATDVLPEFAVDAADPAEFPDGLGELLDENVFADFAGLRANTLTPCTPVHSLEVARKQSTVPESEPPSVRQILGNPGVIHPDYGHRLAEGP
jgi:hypothetical protein